MTFGKTFGALGAQRRRNHSRGAVTQPPVGAPAFSTRTIDRFNMLVFDAYVPPGARYRRDNLLIVLNGSSATLNFWACVDSGGGSQALRSSSYTLLVDGEAVTTNGPFRTVQGVVNGGSSFTVLLNDIAEGWHLFDIDGLTAPETAVPVFMYVTKLSSVQLAAGAKVPAQPMIPVESSTYDLFHVAPEGLATDNAVTHFYGLMPNPNAIQATPVTLAPAEVTRECPAFATEISRNNFFRENIVPSRPFMLHRVCENKNGIVSTFNRMSYYFADMVQKYPAFPLLDGPRNVGTANMLTHVRVDRHGGAYCADPWRVLRIAKDGTVTTRAGYKHKHSNPLPRYWEDQMFAEDDSTIELIGNWSAIPSDRWGFHEIWGLAFDEDSLVLDEDDPQIVNPTSGQLESPHLNPVRLFVADSQNDRICLLTFQRNSFTAPPAVTEFLTSRGDPWDVVWYQSTIIVSERRSNQINQYDDTTGAFIRTIVEGTRNDLFTLTDDRFVLRANPDGLVPPVPPTSSSYHYSLDPIVLQVQAEPVCAPEGLYILDDWLYYGMSVAKQVKRIHLVTGEIQEIVRNMSVGDTDDMFVKISVSDGTFGPRHTVFTSTWSATPGGFPQAYPPPYTLITKSNGQVETEMWNASFLAVVTKSDLMRGRGPLYCDLDYSGATGTGQGRLYCGSSLEGLVRLSQALATDPVPTNAQRARYKAGQQTWIDRGNHILHGWAGFNYHGFPLPWDPGGPDATDMNFYLTWQGHTYGS